MVEQSKSSSKEHYNAVSIDPNDTEYSLKVNLNEGYNSDESDDGEKEIRKEESFEKQQKSEKKKKKIMIIVMCSILIPIVILCIVQIGFNTQFFYTPTSKIKNESVNQQMNHYEKYGNLRYLHGNDASKDQITLLDIQIKGSHNSYDLGSLVDQLNFNSKQPYQGGCLNIELDLQPDPSQNYSELPIEQWNFLVSHDLDMNNVTDYTLKDAFDQIITWLEQQPLQDGEYQHLPIIITFDIKPELGKYYQQFEKINQALTYNIQLYLTQSQIFTPNNFVQGQQVENLYQYIQKNGFPLYQNLWGKFIFVVSGGDKNSDVFQLRQNIAQQAFQVDNQVFVDIDSRIIGKDKKYTGIAQSMQNEPNRIFYNQDVRVKKGLQIDKQQSSKIKEAQQIGLFTRGWHPDDEKPFKYCEYGLKLNIVTTDSVFNNSFTYLK